MALGGGLAGCGGDDGASDEKQQVDDAQAKAAARNAQVALETYFTDKLSYEGATADTLAKIEPSLSGADLTVITGTQNYEVTARSASGHDFTVTHDPGGIVSRSCEPEGQGGCSDTGEW
jgi:type II secretory pathway pseudopilin PulG